MISTAVSYFKAFVSNIISPKTKRLRNVLQTSATTFILPVNLPQLRIIHRVYLINTLRLGMENVLSDDFLLHFLSVGACILRQFIQSFCSKLNPLASHHVVPLFSAV